MFINDIDLDKVIAILAAKAESKSEEDKITKLLAFDSSYFYGKSHLEDDGTHNYLTLQPVHKYLKTAVNTNKVTV